MRLKNAIPPFVREGPSVTAMLGTVIAALCSLLIVPVIRYGMRPVTMAGAAVLTCLLCESAGNLVRGKGFGVSDLSPVVTGLTAALLLPLNAPLWLPCAVGAFAILAAKVPFGSFGRNPFNPAAAGTAFAALCWPNLFSLYFDPAKPYVLPPFADCTFQAGEPAAAVLKGGLMPDIYPMNILLGEDAGPLGTGLGLVIGACALLLFLSRAAHWEATVSFLTVAVLLAAFFPRIACGPITSTKYELLSGSLLFCAVFMISDPVTSPRTPVGRAVYGALAGVVLMAFRHRGVSGQSACFAVLAANAMAPVIDAAEGRLRGWEGMANGIE